jgi:uncharacterized protein
MANPLQDQLLKAGLIKKQKLDAAVRQQNRQKDGKAPPPPPSEQVNAQKLLAERAERDRALAAERNAQARARELQAQIRQIIETHRLKREGEIAYRFEHGGKIKSLLIDDAQRKQLAKGALVVVAFDQGYELLARAAGTMITERGGTLVVDHAGTPSTTDAASSDDYYSKFVVPDDLMW